MQKNYNVYGIGHALVDTELEVDDVYIQKCNLAKGQMGLVDQARQGELLGLLPSGGEHKRGCGGSAANTVIGLTQFGGKGFFSCKVADDETGTFFAKDMTANGVDNRLDQSQNEGHTGQCLVFITPDAERTMCTHLGISETVGPAQLDESQLKQAEYVYVEGYLVTSPSALQAAMGAAKMARANGVKVAVTFSDVSMIQFFGDGLKAIMEGSVDLLFCNEAEAKAFAGTDDLGEAANRLKAQANQVVITLGAKGAMIIQGDEITMIDGVAVKAVDTNGAGDLFAGAFLYGITNGLDAAGAGELACAASAQLVTQYGARLQAGQAGEILARVRG